jgi:hypothetical protein
MGANGEVVVFHDGLQRSGVYGVYDFIMREIL